jgi:hypothetical protein
VHHLYDVHKVGAVYIHLVYVGDTGDVILVRLTPNGFRLGFDPAFRAESRDGAVKYAERSFDLDREVDVSRGVYYIDSVSVPETGSGGRRYRYTSLLLLNHKVHGRRAFVNLAEFMSLSRVEKYSLGSGRLARVDMGHYTYISGML